MKRFFCVLLSVLALLTLAAPAWAVGPAESDVYSEQLSETALQIYGALDDPANLEHFYTGEGVELTISLDGEDFDTAAQRLFQAESYAFSAFELNHPELFWLDGSGVDLSGNDAALTMTVTPHFESDWTEGARSTRDDAATVASAVEQLAEEARAQGGTYEQLLYVHDWLTLHNVYNLDAAAEGGFSDYLPWTPLGALTDLSQPVCEGYSKAFKLVCDALGIPCLTVDGSAGGGHMWNHVLLDGSWYAVDVTWDDPVVSGVTDTHSGSEMHDYFLVGADTVPDGEDLPFSQSHIPDGIRIIGTSFDFPPLAAEAFDPDAPHASEEEPEPIVFADVDETAYYADAVRWAVAAGVTNGTKLHDENGRNWFSPDAAVTRGQAVTFLWRALGEPEPETAENPFKDVKASDYFYKAVLWAVENHVTNGRAADRFAPGEPVRRGEMLTFLWRAQGRPGETEPYDGKQWYADAEGWAYTSGVLGVLEDSYRRGESCPRGDVVYSLFRAAAADE